MTAARTATEPTARYDTSSDRAPGASPGRYDELCHGKVLDRSREQFLSIIDGLRQQGAEAVIEGCTKIVMLVQREHTDVPLYDTTALHVASAVDFMLSEDEPPRVR